MHSELHIYFFNCIPYCKFKKKLFLRLESMSFRCNKNNPVHNAGHLVQETITQKHFYYSLVFCFYFFSIFTMLNNSTVIKTLIYFLLC